MKKLCTGWVRKMGAEEKHERDWDEQRRENREDSECSEDDSTMTESEATDSENAIVCDKDPIVIDGERYYVSNEGGQRYYVLRKSDRHAEKVDLAKGHTGEVNEWRQAALLARPTNLEAERQAFTVMQQYANEIRELHKQSRDILHGLDPDQFQAGGGASDSSSQSGQSSGGSDSDNGEQDTSLTQDYPESEEHVGEIENWVADAADLMGDLDPDAMEYEAAEVDGEVGVKFEANPFKAGYWTDGDWTDKDGFDDHKDALKTVTQNNDEVDYHGKPDYFNFVPASKVESLTE